MNNLKYYINNVELTNYYDNYDNRLIKIFNNSKQKKRVKIYYYYPSVFFPYYLFEKEISVNEWVIPDHYYLKSCGFIIVYVDEVVGQITLLSEKKNKKVSDKLICVGLNKTGTSSLARSLKNIGLITWADGRPKHSLDFSNYSFSNQSIGVSIDLIEKTEVDFFQDIPFSCPGVSERIINIFPQSKYVLTVRESVDKWVNSVKNFWKPYFKNNEFVPNAINGVEQYYYDKGHVLKLSYLLSMFETWELDKYEGNIDEKLTQVYINHNNSVRSVLKSNNCDWIEIDVSKKGEFKKLTDWLKIENQEEDFVWINKTEK